MINNGAEALEMTQVASRGTQEQAVLPQISWATAIVRRQQLHDCAPFGEDVAFNASLLPLKHKINEKDKDGRTELHLACSSGQATLVESLIQGGAQVDAVDLSGSTSLHLACRYGQARCVDSLIQAKCEVGAVNFSGSTALHLACRYGHAKCVDLLIQARAQVNAMDFSENTALHLALQFRHLNIAKMLLKENHSSLWLVDNKRRTPLHEAVLTGSEELCQIMLQCGTNCAVKHLNLLDASGKSALMLACSGGFTKVVKCIFEGYNACRCKAPKTCNPAYVKDKEGAAAIHYAVQKNCRELLEEFVLHVDCLSLNVAKKCGSTALHLAASTGYTAAVEILVNAGADIDAVDQAGATPLHCASGCNQLQCVVKLLEKGANVGALDGERKTAWHWAAAAGHREVLKTLLNKADRGKFKQIISDANHQTPLHDACLKGQLQCAEEILEWASCDGQSMLHSLLRAEDSSGQTAVHQAASKAECSDILALLLHYSSDMVNWTEGNRKTPLHVAAEYNCLKNIELLLNNYADVSATDCEGRTALHLACANSSRRGKQLFDHSARGSHGLVVELLLKAGSSIDIADNCGNTALHLACMSNSAEDVQILMDAGCDVTLSNDNGATALETCIACLCKDSTIAIIQHAKWEDAMSCHDDKGITMMNKLIQKMPAAAQVVLDRCYENKECDYPTETDLQKTYNFKYISGGDVGFCQFSTWPVQEMVHHQRLKLLRHPLVRVMMNRRWLTGMYSPIYIYALRLILLLLLLLCVTCVALLSILGSSQSSNVMESLNLSIGNVTMEVQPKTVSFIRSTGYVPCLLIITIAQFIAMAISVLLGCLEISSWRHGICCVNINMPKDLCLVTATVTTFIFVYPVGYYPTTTLQAMCGSCAILTTLFSLILETRCFLITSVCISYMMWRAFWVCYMYALFIFAAYGAVFRLLLPEKVEFQWGIIPIVSAANMAIGEVDFPRIFLDTDSPYMLAAIAAEFSFLFFVNVTFMNFLTAYAVRQLKEILNDADTYTLIYQIAAIEKCEATLPRTKMEESYTAKEEKTSLLLVRIGQHLCNVFQIQVTDNSKVHEHGQTSGPQVKRSQYIPSSK